MIKPRHNVISKEGYLDFDGIEKFDYFL